MNRTSTSDADGNASSSSNSSQNRIAASRCANVRATPRHSQRTEPLDAVPRIAMCTGDALANRNPFSNTSSTLDAEMCPPDAAPIPIPPENKSNTPTSIGGACTTPSSDPASGVATGVRVGSAVPATDGNAGPGGTIDDGSSCGDDAESTTDTGVAALAGTCTTPADSDAGTRASSPHPCTTGTSATTISAHNTITRMFTLMPTTLSLFASKFHAYDLNSNRNARTSPLLYTPFSRSASSISHSASVDNRPCNARPSSDAPDAPPALPPHCRS